MKAAPIVAGAGAPAPVKNPTEKAGTFPSSVPQPAADFDFEDAGEQIKNLLSLAMFVECARHLTGELEAAADRSVQLRQMMNGRDIAYSDAYFDLEESAGLLALLRHAQELASEAKDAGMALSRASSEGVKP